MLPLATIEEFADRIPGGIDGGDTARAQAMLVDASALIRSEAGITWTDDDPPVTVPDVVKTICMSAAKRAFLNPDGVNSVAIDGHSASFATGSPDVYLTRAEKSAVRRAAGKIAVWTQPTTRSEDDIPDTPSVVADPSDSPSEESDPLLMGWS